MDDKTQNEIAEDFRRIDLPGLIHHPDGTHGFKPRWSKDQLTLLDHLRARGKGFTEIGAKIGKSRHACYKKWMRENG